MSTLKKTTFAVALLLASSTDLSAQLIINELMQSNIDCIMDDLNEFPDSWVELYNSGTEVVNLGQYRLGITNEASRAWQLPSKSIVPGQYIIVYCDKEATGIHTDYRLESGKGCEVYLFQNSNVVDQVTELKKQPAPNISYGRVTSGSPSWGYQATPTPSSPNCGRTCSAVLGEPIFSEPGRVFTQQQQLTLSLSLPDNAPSGAEIRFTTNGSEPTRISQLYISPITISSSCVVRAKVFCDGWLSPCSTTQSYIFHGRAQTLPVVSLVTDNRYLNDPKIGIYVEGTYNSQKKNYEYNWRRPINIELFDESGTPSQINQLCETRIQGGATRGNKYKSLAVYAHKRFGTKRLAYEFFPDQRPGVKEFKSIVLRNAGNDFDYLYMRDAIIQRAMAEHCDLDWQAWRPAIVYINGIYSGMLNIRERANEDNVWTHYDELEDIDMIENWWDLKEGDWTNYNQFKTFYAEHGHTMAEYEQWMDCREFINLMLMNLYFNNQDFPGNNIVMWRPRTTDGRWRFIAKDTDFGLGLYGSSAYYNSIEWIYNPNYDADRAWANQYEHTRLFRRLMEDPDFNREFIDRAAIYMGDFLNATSVRAIWDPMYETIREEYPHHRFLINQWWPNYTDELNTARNWLSNRTASFYQQIKDYYQLGALAMMKVNNEVNSDDLTDVEISFNGVNLRRGVFDGKFFANRTVTLSGKSTGNKQVTGWYVRQIGANGSVTSSEVTGETYSFNMPECNTLFVNAILGDASGINELSSRSWSWHINEKQLFLYGIAAGSEVRLYDMQGVLQYRILTGSSNVVLPLTDSRFYILKVGAETVKISNPAI